MLFTVFVLIFSAICHEYAHGWVAYKLGDNTAKDAGRLTLNPIAHLDLFGSVILPLLLLFTKTGFILGWAKPVPYNPYNLRDPKYGDLKVAIGGPGTNFILAAAFGLLARAIAMPLVMKQNLILAFFRRDYDFLLGQMNGSLLTSIFVMAVIVCFINILLMIFNLIPIPPLDGSKVLMAFLPYDWRLKLQRIEPYGIFIILFLLMFGLFSLIWPLIIWPFSLLVGV
jgi:Zn-dependent protease